MRVISCLVTDHNLWLVSLAAIICVLGSAITFSLYQRARERSGSQKNGWTFLTAVAAGSSIWCTHFIAMLAYNSAAPVTFDPIFTMVSLIVAIAGCGIGFGISAFNKDGYLPEVSGAIVGLSVACMHYTGMAAYHVAGIVDWDTAYVAASVILAASISALAVRVAVRSKYRHSLAVAVALFVVSIVALHFTGMAAVAVTPLGGHGDESSQQAFAAIAVAVASVGLMVVGTGVASYMIDERTAAETVNHLRRLALNDALTGLPNRVHLNEYLNKELARAEQNSWSLAVVGIDLNHFKEINDLRGHAAGDQTLKVIGERLASLLQPGEFAARVGGDEFAAIKRFAGTNELHEFVARLETALTLPIAFDDFEAVTGGSIGVALYPQDGRETEVLLSNADLAMYRAKIVPDSSVCFYEKEMDEAARERKSLRADLLRAIELGEFHLHYQVQTLVTTGEVSGYEALLRWNHRERGAISPEEFIPIAEESGSIVEIGEWVLRTACSNAASWSGGKIAVNVSGVQLARADFAEKVHAILVETGLSPSRLELEITETALIADKVRALHTLRRIRNLGVAIAIDDFGAGYSSLETLRAFPFSKIKLDRSFTRGLERDAQAKAIVRAVLALGKSLDIPVLAEGVETVSQLEILRDESCDEAQGYLIGRPGPSGGAANLNVALEPAVSLAS
ncbi:diguanylate cyclase (GGDEF)-like protein [Variibacter gotjawalensis]|uniref:bifunctional diguanylate cyclase/phosphodiesterase n=1 Tax=Variibacter gotjawalensis TaxID=1333996 RepID=UPI000BBA577B|nr:bifunctional diguanylate cyclase/phosphodiesterase [Variibacter gotjawalensis]NIK50137.1 diguanylate cyclase (GGDEF)-like protein [Variibacter gotjawalensis]